MSGIISSFIIDPVVRQARRFSAAPKPESDDGEQFRAPAACDAPSHVSARTAISAPAPAAGLETGRERPPRGVVLSAGAPFRSTATTISSTPATTGSTSAVSVRADSTQCRPISAAGDAHNAGLGQALFDRFVPLMISSRWPLATDQAPSVHDVRPPETHDTTENCSATYLPVAGGANSTMGAAESVMDMRFPDPSGCADPHHHGVDDVDIFPSTRQLERAAAVQQLRRQDATSSIGIGVGSGLPLSTRRAITAMQPRAIERAGISHGSTPEEEAIVVSGSLPEDDGFQMLRQRIHAIRSLAVTNEEKARDMHNLMTEGWYASQARILAQSPASNASHERPISSGSVFSTPSSPAPPILTPVLDPSNPYNVYPSDLEPSFRSPPPSEPYEEGLEEEEEEEEEEEGEAEHETHFGCEHYKRNIKVQCYDCKSWYPCRHCHDSAQSTHKLNRHATENMLCMLCQTPQPAAQYCKECGMRAAWYYCDTCKLWDDDGTKRIYHCNDCGICRRGEGIGKDFTHCKKCNVCIAIGNALTHRCIERAIECDCPICGDYMFTSSENIVAMPCGHYLHHACYNAYMATAYQCPVCKKSAINMELQWRKLELEIENQPMPSQWHGTKVEIRCNDCGGRSRVPYHWLGNKCSLCDGYNTVEVRLVNADADDAEQQRWLFRQHYLDRRLETRQSFPPTTAPSAPAVLAGGTRTFGAGIPPQFRARSYFADDEDGEGAVRPGSAGEWAVNFTMPNAFDVLARVGRSLTPIRQYFEEEGVSPRRSGRDGERVADGEESEESSEESSEDETDDDWAGEIAVEEGDGEDDDDEDEELAQGIGRALDRWLNANR